MQIASSSFELSFRINLRGQGFAQITFPRAMAYARLLNLRMRLILSLLLLAVLGPALVIGEPTRRVDGYKGIWFTLGQFFGEGTNGQPYAPASRKPVFPYGDKYSGGLGTYTAKHTPLAIYCPEVGKTFFVYGGTVNSEKRHLLCMVSYYDHSRGMLPRPVVVHDKNGVDGPHDNPSLSVDAEGHLWVFVSGRGAVRPGFKYRSREPYSIDGFERVSEEEFTYPQPHYLEGKGFLHLFTRYTGRRELYWERSEGGRSWTPDRKLAGIRSPGDQQGGHYQTSATADGVTGTFFNRHPRNGHVDYRTDLYYVQTRDMGETWTTVDGRVLETPLTEVEYPSRVVNYHALGLNVYLKDMGFDREGHPVLLYVTSPGAEPGPPNDPRHFRIIRWDGMKWVSRAICRTDHNYDMGSLYLGDDCWRVIIPSSSGPQPYHGGGEMSLWESFDQGTSWQLVRQMTSQSPRNHNYARRPLRARDPFYAFWADGDPTRLSESHLYFTDSTAERIWRLPYVMDGEWAKPIWVDGGDSERAKDVETPKSNVQATRVQP